MLSNDWLSAARLLMLVAALPCGSVARAGDWPAFLGPDRTGMSTETGLNLQWPDAGPPLLWTAEIGTGYSAPSVWGDMVVINHRIGDEHLLEARNAATGNVLWTHRSPSQFRDPYGYNNGPRATVALTATHCFALTAEGTLLCVDRLTGHEVWQRSTGTEFDVPAAFFGAGASPLLYEDLVIAFVGGQPNSGVVAFRQDNGQTVWQSVGQSTWDGVATGWRRQPNYKWTGEEMVVSYASPTLATFHGQPHLLCLTRQGLVSLHPRTGVEWFKTWFRSETHESVNATTPIAIGNRVLVSSAYGVGTKLFEVGTDGRTLKQLWHAADVESHWATPVAVGELIYGFGGRHEGQSQLYCLQAETGATLWATDGAPFSTDAVTAVSPIEVMEKATGKKLPWPLFGRGSFTGVDGKFILLGERATLATGQFTPQGYVELARFHPPGLDNPSWVAPVIAHGRLLLRDEDTLMCFSLRFSETPPRE